MQSRSASVSASVLIRSCATRFALGSDEQVEATRATLPTTSADELDDIGNAANDGDDAEKAAAQVQLDELEARLSSCL